MLGENPSEGEEEPELTAGMSATFFGVQLRPVVFFQGYTDLMAKVLLSSGEPTSVVRGNLLLMDHHQVLDGEEAATCLHTTSQQIQQNEPVVVTHHRLRSKSRVALPDVSWGWESGGMACSAVGEPCCRVGTDIPSSHKALAVSATHPRAVPGHRELCLFRLPGHSSAVWPPGDHQTAGWAGAGHFS